MFLRPNIQSLTKIEIKNLGEILRTNKKKNQDFLKCLVPKEKSWFANFKKPLISKYKVYSQNIQASFLRNVAYFTQQKKFSKEN